MVMAAVEHYLELFVEAKTKYTNKNEAFEEHFLWLEEALVAARQSFAHAEQTLLPKTPAAKKRVRQKKRDTSPILEDGESPSKKLSIESTKSQDENQSPECPPLRRGRAASRLAQEKVKKNLKENIRCKLRRPSTPVDNSRTIQKTKATKQVEESRNSVEIESTAESRTEPTPPEGQEESAPVEMETKQADVDIPTHVPKVQSTCTKKKPGDSGIAESLKPLSASEVESVGDEDGGSQCSSNSFVLPKVSKERSTPLRSSTAESRIEPAPPEGQEESAPVEVETKQADVDIPTPVPKARSTRTKKKPNDSGIAESLKPLSASEAESVGEENGGSQCSLNSFVSSEVFKVRLTPLRSSTAESRIELAPPGVQEESAPVEVETKQADVNLPPPEVPKARSTRTKKKPNDSGIAESLKPLSASEAESVGEEDGGSQCSSSSFVSPEVPKVRSTRTKKKHDGSGTTESLKHISASEGESVGEEDSGSQCVTSSFVPPEVPKARSTRTKKKQTDDCSLSDGSVSEAPKPRSTRTKKKIDEGAKGPNASEDVYLPSETGSTDSSCVPQSRSTRTKKRQVEDQANQPVRTTRTKRRKVEDEENKENVIADSGDNLKSSNSPESRALSLIKKYQNNIEKLVEDNKKENNDANKTGTKRLTRSKVRQVPQMTKASPRKASPYCTKKFESPSSKQDFQRDCCSPKLDQASPKKRQPVASRVASPLRSSPRCFSEKNGYSSKATYKKLDGHAGVEEIKSNDIEVVKSPARITRHSGGKAVRRESSTRRYARKSIKRAKKILLANDAQRFEVENCETPDSKWERINPQPRTPSPQCPTEKIVRTKFGHILSGSSSYGSSGRISPKTYSRIKPGLMNSASSSSSEFHKTLKRMNTPTEIKRTKNIVSGVSSFIKVQAPKPSREELEEKRQMELQKKREREDETRKKKEEILKSKVEEQKKRNEERMRRAKEAREEKERKAEAAKELQKTERKQREERLKEEQQKKKQQMLARKQAEEEAKARKLKEQMEEERRRLEEIRLAEEARKVEEARRAEEERRAEQERLQEEERRKKRAAEVERIARERKEMEQLKLREAERLAAAKKAKLSPLQKIVINKTALNSTFTKGSAENKENSGNHNATFTKNSGGNEKHGSSYERTPDHKIKVKKHTAPNVHNYNINDIKSDDSTDDESAPKKQVPTWAQGNQLKASLINQEYYPPEISSIFPPEELLTMPDLMQIFSIVRRRFFKRTSSAIWTTPPSKLMD